MSAGAHRTQARTARPDCDDSQPGRANKPHRSRSEWLSACDGMTRADVAIALEFAQTPDEVDAAAHLSLLLFTVAGCNDPFTERGRTWPALHRLVNQARGRVRGFPESMAQLAEQHRLMSEAATAQRRREAREARAERLHGGRP